jgi:hypothetical protein
VRIALRASGLVVLFAAGALLASLVAAGGRAQETTVTATETATTTETTETTAPATTVVTTVQETRTERVIVPTVAPAPTATTIPAPTTTESTSNSSNGTPAWVWVLLGILAVGLIALVIVLLTRRGGTAPPDERRRRLDHATGSWAAQGWALEQQTGDSAVLRRAGERMLVSVDEAGHVSTRPLPNE